MYKISISQEALEYLKKKNKNIVTVEMVVGGSP